MDNINIYKDPNCDLFKESEIYFNKDSYIVSMNENVIGHFNLIYNLLGKNMVSIDYELLEQYRGKKMGNLLFGIIESYVIENTEVDNIVLLIKSDNIKSKTIAENYDYSFDYGLSEWMGQYNEMPDYIPFCKNFKKVKQKKLV